jgi:sphingolipid delta-4 desaturase
MENHFHESPLDQPHPVRTKELIKKYPEIRTLMGKNPYTALIMLIVLSLQVGIAYWMGSLGMGYWWLSFIVAFAVGAFANHCMYVIIHEASHNLVFTSKDANRFVAMMADLPNLVPGSMGFFVYHLKHHAHQGDYDYDADMANHWEAKFIGNNFFGKAFWLAFFPFFQLTRPPRLKSINMWSKWPWINLAMALTFDFLIVYFLGWNALVYLLFSFFLSIGLHPVGARWIQEHYTPDGSQETFSYYGPINIIALNVGYHNEHHDFPSIPWNNLPKIKAIAPEYYNNIKFHRSWFKLWLTFLFDNSYSLFSRVERVKEGKVDYMRAAKKAA